MDAEDFDMGDSPSARMMGALFGFFLMAFGMPFTFVPLLIFGDGSMELVSFAGLFMVLFTIPFVVAGLFVQFIGFSMILLSLRPGDAKNIGRLNKVLGNQSLDANQEYWQTNSSDVVGEGEQDLPSQGENFWDTIES